MDNPIGFGTLTHGDTPDKRKSVGNADPRLTRTNYFDGRLLTARDLIRDQHYLDDRAREVGRAIGSGIARGLAVELSDRGVLTVRPGLAVAPSGRVLELSGHPLYLNLYDQALLSELNGGRSQVLDNGLYAVAIQYMEVGTDSAEVYPQDLASERTFHFNSYTEGVEVVLVPLRTPLPQTNKVKGQRRLSGHRGLGARAALVPELVYRTGQPPELPGDAVALALLAVRDQRPQWLDLGLVRRPLRPPHSPLALHHDLHAHYTELFDQVTTVRDQLGLRQDYPADLYFRQLPSHGPAPKDGLSPESGSQTFFPKQINVQIAPVREGDLPALIAESAALDPIDLESGEPAEVMVVVPMDDTTFAWRARQLQHDALGLSVTGHSRLAHIDPLALRLRIRPPAHQVDTDSSVWRDIWSETEGVYYLRRPPRVAETQVSAVVLARGYELPKPGTRPPPNTAVLEQQLADARDELRKCEQALEKAKRELESAGTSDTAAELAAYRERLAESERRLQDARDRANEAAAEAEQALAEAAETERSLRRAEDRIADLQRRLDEQPDATANPDLEAELAASQAEVARLRERLQDAQARAALADSLQAERDRLDSELTAAQARIVALEALVDGGDTALQEQLTACRTRVADLEEDLASAQAAAARADALRAERDEIAQRLTNADERILQLEEQLAGADTGLQAELDLCREEHAAARADRERLAGELATVRAQLEECRRNQGGATLDLERVLEVRKVSDAGAREAAAALAEAAGTDTKLSQAISDVLLLVDRRYDPVLFESLLNSQRAGRLAAFGQFLAAQDPTKPLGEVVAADGKDFGLSDTQLEEWASLSA